MPLDMYPEEEGTLLDLVFGDRWRMWANFARATGSQIQWKVRQDGQLQRFFEFDATEFEEPGDPPLIEGRDPRDPSSYDYHAPRLDSGPDGKGDDMLIKTPAQLISSLVEVVEKLPLLHAFSRNTALLAMPTGVGNALEQLDTLKSLHVDMTLIRNNLQTGESSVCCCCVSNADHPSPRQSPTGSSSATSSRSRLKQTLKLLLSDFTLGVMQTGTSMRMTRMTWCRTSCLIGSQLDSRTRTLRRGMKPTAPS